MKLKRSDYVFHSAAVVAKINARYNQFLRPQPPLHQLSAVCGEVETPCVSSTGVHRIMKYPQHDLQPSGICESWQSLQPPRPFPDGLGFKCRGDRGRAGSTLRSDYKI